MHKVIFVFITYLFIYGCHNEKKKETRSACNKKLLSFERNVIFY